MRFVTRDVLLMTVLMVAPIVAIELLGLTTSGRLEGFLVGNWLTMPVLSGVVTVLTWSWLVARQSSVAMLRGILVGALCAAIVLAIPTFATYLQLGHTTPKPDAGLVTAAGWLSLAIYWLVGVPLGAIFGAVAIGARRATVVKPGAMTT